MVHVSSPEPATSPVPCMTWSAAICGAVRAPRHETKRDRYSRVHAIAATNRGETNRGWSTLRQQPDLVQIVGGSRRTQATIAAEVQGGERSAKISNRR